MRRFLRYMGFRALMLAVVMFGLATAAQADTINLNFDSVSTSSTVDATSYFASHGITLSGVTAGTQVSIMAYSYLYGGAALVPVSSPNLLMQTGSNAPVSFTMNFSTPLTSFSFVRPGDLAPSSFPAWQAYAFAGSTLIASTGQSYSCCQAAGTYTLAGPGITSIRFDSQNGNFAAFNAVPLDNFTLQTAPEPGTMLLMGVGLLGFTGKLFRARR